MKKKKRRFGFQAFQDAGGKWTILRSELFGSVEEMLAAESKAKATNKKRKAA